MISIETLRQFVPFSELLASIIGTIYFAKYKHTHLKYFLYLLWFITFIEFSAWISSEKSILIYVDEDGVKYNLWYYNFLGIITFITLFYIYFKTLKTKTFKIWVKIFGIIFIITSIINWVFFQNFIKEWAELPDVLGSIFLIITIIFYLVELLKSDKITVYHRILLFWISIGLLLYYTGSIPFILKVNGYALIPGIHKLFLIFTILALLMYLIFTFGFIWSRKE